MHICIVGAGAAGWIACNFLKNKDFIKKITVVGSSKLPSIGVGESTTVQMSNFVSELIRTGDFSLEDFLIGTNAAIKYGVLYKNWSEKDFLHYFKSTAEFSKEKTEEKMIFYGRMLANKPENVHVHEIMGKEIFECAKNNNLALDQNFYGMSYHFDANKFIEFMSNLSKKNKKVSFIDDKVIGGQKPNDSIFFIDTEKNGRIHADFYIFATGDYKINEEFLGIKYKSYSDILLTNKAIAYPLPYKNKKEEMHPYTVAKTMKYGWRWITPTWERIGTGYVFSDHYISVDKAVDEFRKDIGDNKIEPFVVDFSPKKNTQEIHENWCTIGMASGFLEPLDAPGLDLVLRSLSCEISEYLNYMRFYCHPNENKQNNIEKERLNLSLLQKYDFWATFILSQYKTSSRLDTEFWKDHKNIKWNFYDNIMQNIDNELSMELMMLHQTMAGKDIKWKTRISSEPYKTISTNFDTINHYEYLKRIREKHEH